MGWAWRSSESYGDKDEPKELPDTDSPGAKEPEAKGEEEKSAKSWWHQYHDDTSPSTSASDDYNSDWRGYQGPTSDVERYDYYDSSYSYSKSIDDSDSRWYRKSSFRYGSYKDYSPSSLFRSAFYSSKTGFYFGSGTVENEAKNKAIRALRTLSRNANTICDKNSKIAYAVQYSSGADTNTFEEALIDGKATKTIYVSPDSVVDAKSTEEEDEAVDALTGFVLLRVQIAQEFKAETIANINGTTLRALPMNLLKIMQSEGEKPSPAVIATDHIDNCLAGMLSKGILTRLARRQVVKDWGGFAPYFVRHAKKFTAVREKLEAGELSIESVVGKLTYNTVDDENSFEIPADIEEIVARHLGEEVAADSILAACRSLIVELRAHLKAKNEDKNPAGPIEQRLQEMLEEFMEEHAESAERKQKETQAAEQMLGELAQAMNEQFLQHHNETGANPVNNGKLDDSADVQEIEQLYAAEQMLSSMRNNLTTLMQYKEALEKATPAEVPFHTSRAAYEQLQVAARMQHFSASVTEMEKRGASQKFDAKKYITPPPGTTTAETLAEEIKDLEALAEEYQNIIKRDTQKVRDRILKTMQEIAAARVAAQEAAKKELEKLKEHVSNISKIYDDADCPEILQDAVHAAKLLEEKAAQAAGRVNNDAEAIKAVENCRSIKTVRKEYEKFKNAAALAGFTADMRREWQYDISGVPTAQFVQTGLRSQHRAEVSAAGNDHTVAEELNEIDWPDAAIQRFLQQAQNNENGFEASAFSQTYAEILEQLKKLFEKSGIPTDTGSIENSDLTKKVQRLAESIGLSDADELLRLAHAAETNVPSTLSAAGEEIGKEIREILPLFDEINSIDNQLFGELVKVKTTVLADSTKQVNDEARNDPEEEYVAYLSHCEAKPVVHIKKPHVSERDRLAANASRTRQRNVISRIREALEFHNSKRTGEIYGVRSGDLDEGGLHKLGYDCEHIWSQKTIAQIPDVAVGILVDQSGSMSGGTKIHEAREMCVALAEAIKRIPGIHLHIYGHTANTKNGSDLTLFEHYTSVSDTATASADLSSLGTIDAIANNYDGYAIKETAKLLTKDPAKRKYLFVIADGLPHGDGYCGKEAEKHVTSVCQFVRERLKIATYAFAVGVPAGHRPKFTAQYGKDNVMFLTTVSSCLPQITRFLRNTIQKEKTLVEVGS